MSNSEEDFEILPKQRKLSYSNDEQKSALDLSSPSTFNYIHLKDEINLNLIKFCSILKYEPFEKSVFILGEYNHEKLILILEKSPFNLETIKLIISTTDKSLSKNFSNDIYGSYTAYPHSEYNPIKVIIIHPATEKHIEKYSTKNYHLIQETFQDYLNLTLPLIEAKKLSLIWVESILNHEREQDRIIIEDNDEENGFILLPDLKWNTNQIEDLHLTAICLRKDIKSLRDLNYQHLPLLENIKLKSLQAIKSQYNLESSQVRSFVHYQPSYYHLHVHFTNISLVSKISNVDRAHLLDSIIENIKIAKDYYQRVTLPILVSDSDELFEKFKKK